MNLLVRELFIKRNRASIVGSWTDEG
ncbi:MAG: hypothetical protein QOJ51_5286, partial [Acidobacteriaceae bacterium]|nr:hypothetical protein [Acidobacteriaceae bacterium]